MQEATIKTAVWGFDHGGLPGVIDAMAGRAAIDPVVWFGRHKACTHGPDRAGCPKPPARSARIRCDAEVYRAVQRKLPELLDALARERPAAGMVYCELLDTFNLWFEFFYKTLVGENIRWVVFSSVPDRFGSFLLYEIARRLDVPVLVLSPAPAANRVFSVNDLDDFGIFVGVPPARPAADLAVSPSREGPESCGRVLRGTRTPPPLSATPDPSCLTPWKTSWQAVRRELRHRLTTRSRRRTLPGLVRILCDGIAARRAWKRHAVGTLPRCGQFVYFSFARRCEEIAASLHGPYCDQLLALEQLRTSLPPDRPIVVDNAQFADSGRPGTLFFDRLTAIPNLSLASHEIPQADLLARCRFVATVGGEAGWNALLAGKPALLFGKPWYRSLPGVRTHHPDLDLESMADCRVSRDEVQSAYRQLMRRTWPGDTEQGTGGLLELLQSQLPEPRRRAA